MELGASAHLFGGESAPLTSIEPGGDDSDTDLLEELDQQGGGTAKLAVPPAAPAGRRATVHKDTLRSCAACSKGKRQCDGLRPCSRCAVLGRDCVDPDCPRSVKQPDVYLGTRILAAPTPRLTPPLLPPLFMPQPFQVQAAASQVPVCPRSAGREQSRASREARGRARRGLHRQRQELPTRQHEVRVRVWRDVLRPQRPRRRRGCRPRPAPPANFLTRGVGRTGRGGTGGGGGGGGGRGTDAGTAPCGHETARC